MAASNHFGSNMQFEPVEETRTNGAVKPVMHRLSRNHKVTAPRNPDPEARAINTPFNPSTSNPQPKYNIIQQYQSLSVNLPPSSYQQLPHSNANTNHWPHLPQAWSHATPFPLLQQAVNRMERRPTTTETWNNSYGGYENNLGMRANIIHEQNTVYSQRGGNLLTATRTLQNFVDRAEDSGRRDEDGAVVEIQERVSLSMPPLEPINCLGMAELKRMAELSRLQRNFKDTYNYNESETLNRSELAANWSSQLQRQLAAPSMNALTAAPTITVPTARTPVMSVPTSPTPTSLTSTVPDPNMALPIPVLSDPTTPNATQHIATTISPVIGASKVSPASLAVEINDSRCELEKRLAARAIPTSVIVANEEMRSDSDDDMSVHSDEVEVVTPSADELRAKIKVESPITISDDESQEEKTENAVVQSESQSSMRDEETRDEEISEEFYDEFPAENADTQGDDGSMNNSFDDDSEKYSIKSNPLVKMRFCTVKVVSGTVRELIATPKTANVFTVNRAKAGVLKEKVFGPCFQKKTKQEDEVTNGVYKKSKMVNGFEDKIDKNYGHKVLKRKSQQETLVPNKMACFSPFGPTTSVAKCSGRKYIDVTICSKCKCKAHDETPCDLTDIYPCLDEKCQKTFLEFTKYQAHVNAHGYNVYQPPLVSDDDELPEAPFIKDDLPATQIECLFCTDTFPSYNSIKLHLKQIHQVKDYSQFFNESNAEYLITEIDIWAREFDTSDGFCKLCLRPVTSSRIKTHLIEVHSCDEASNILKILPKEPKKDRKKTAFIVPASETVNSDVVPSTDVIVREVRLVEPDVTLETAAPSLKDVENWLKGLEDSATSAGICCLYCKKMYLSSFAMYKHLKGSHGSSIEKILGKNLLDNLEEVENNYSVKEKLAFCSDKPEVDRLTEKLKILLTHFIDAETLNHFEFDTLPVQSVLVKILYLMGTSYCLFSEFDGEEMMLDGLNRNLRTLILFCVAEEARKVVGFDTESIETVLDNLFEFIGIV